MTRLLAAIVWLAVSLPAFGQYTGIYTKGPSGSSVAAFSDLTGSATCAQLPALTGGVTTSAGSCATTTVTNANLTGPITSSGNATSIASQTGTGTTFAMSASPTFTGTLTSAAHSVVSGSFGLSGNISAPAWTTAGIRYANVTATLTDTTSSGTVTNARTDNFGGNTIAASSATTFTNYYSAYFTNPIAGTNVTLTNKAAIGADSISIGGAAQSTYALAVTGTAAISSDVTAGFFNSSGYIAAASGFYTANNGYLQINAPGVFQLQSWAGNIAKLSIPAAATLQLGAAAASTAVAQKLQVQPIVTGTSNTSGALWTLQDSIGTGTGASGGYDFRVAPAGGSGTTPNASASALAISSSALTLGAAVVAPAATGTRYLCISTAGVVTSSAVACAGT